MKRKKLIKHLARHGASFLREGGEHTIFHVSGTERQSAVPRHTEIKPNLVRKICKDLGIKPPTEK